MKAIKYTGTVVLFIFAVYILGPRMPDPHFNKTLPSVGGDVSRFVDSIESINQVRPDNRAKIIWANDSLKNRTNCVLLYLHGFSASWYEGFPINNDFGHRYHCNTYLSRLASHGLITANPLLDMTPCKLYESAKKALVIAHKLGDKVIIMSTSTGGTLALMLAADFPELVDGLILYSPNIRIKQKASILLSKPWGLQIARLNFGGDFRTINDPEEICKYWYCKYRAEGPVYLQQLLDKKMNEELFRKVKCPVFLGYYYKDKEHQDQTVSVDAAIKMFNQLGTFPSEKQKVAFPDAGSHVIACKLTSKSIGEVESATWSFSEKILKLKVTGNERESEKQEVMNCSSFHH
jgi:pimeloyl-ACP methyl ester carboxylesterase